MFVKYINQFHKAEAEWALEVLDMYDGDQRRAQAMLLDSINRIIARRKEGLELDTLDATIDACFFASRSWWQVGLAKLRELGKIPQLEQTVQNP